MNFYAPPSPNDHRDSPDSRAQKIRTIWTITRGIYVLAVLGLVSYWHFNNMALPDYICELQAEHMFPGYCYSGINFGFSVGAFLVPLFIVQFILEKITRVKLRLFTR